MTATDLRLRNAREELRSEEMAIACGWGDPAKTARLTVLVKELTDEIQAQKVEDWERYKEAHARVFPESETVRPLPPIPPELQALVPMGYDETFHECEDRINRAYLCRLSTSHT